MAWVPVLALVVSVLAILSNAATAVVVFRMTQTIRRFDRLEDAVQTAATRLVDTRFATVTAALESIGVRLRDGDTTIASLAARDQQIELAVTARFEVLKDFLRNELVTSKELDKLEKDVKQMSDGLQGKFTQLAEQFGRLDERVAQMQRGKGARE